MISYSSLIYTLIVPTSVILLAVYYIDYVKSVLVAFKIPGPPALPILGHVFLVKDNKQMEYMGINMSQLYGPIMKFWILIFPMFVISEPSHLQIILGTNKCSTKNMFYSFLPNLIGEGLVTLNGVKWKFHRRLIQPYFHINVLSTFFNVFQKYSNNLVHTFKNNSDHNIVHFANKFVLNVMHDAVFGIPFESTSETCLFRSCKSSLLDRTYKPWLLFNTFFKMTEASRQEIQLRNNIQEYTKQLVKKRMKQQLNCEKDDNKSCIMDMMIEISKKNSDFTEEDVINETASFILVGQDSVATSLAFTLYFLAAYQDVQDKVVNELNSIYKNNDHTGSFEDVNQMKYLEQCIKESLRLCPSLPLLARKLIKEVQLGAHKLPVGSNIFISPFVTHRLPHVFPDPLVFNPDRFSPDNKKNIHPYGYIPFSIGPRNCIGYKFAVTELKIVISHILRHYKISITPGHEQLDLLYNITLKAKGGIWLRFQKREK